MGFHFIFFKCLHQQQRHPCLKCRIPLFCSFSLYVINFFCVFGEQICCLNRLHKLQVSTNLQQSHKH